MYPLVLEELKTGFKDAIGETAAFFMRRYGKKQKYSKADVLSSHVPEEVIALDKQLHALCKDIETLNFINPINIAAEKKRFFARRDMASPNFTYKQLNINPYEFREQLYKLPVADIADAGIQQLYRHIVDNLATKIDLLTTIGSDDFLYNSLKYYGKPNSRDIANANFILHAPELPEEASLTKFDATHARDYFIARAKDWQLDCKIEISTKIVAKAMVNSAKKQLLINKDATFTEPELDAFAHHELGVHMLTTILAKQQPLKVFALGLVGNTHTQEGVAIFSEYCSGNLTLKRLKALALRVVAVDLMLKQQDFLKTYQTLRADHGMEKESAFTLTTRVYRGGGFTKDHLYLRGFSGIVNLYHNQAPLEDLLVGKTGLLDLPVISEMIARGMIDKPTSLFEFKLPDGKPIIDYLVSAIR